MSQTRRLTAILAADVAGYSRLMGADEEGTHERLQASFRELVNPKIAEHQGRLVKTTGDGLLVEFASVVEAVRCAAEVQRGMLDREPDLHDEQRIRFRIGAHDSSLERDGFELPVPGFKSHLLRRSGAWSRKGPGSHSRVLTTDNGRFTVRRARLAPAMISTPGHRASRRRQREALPAWRDFLESRLGLPPIKPVYDAAFGSMHTSARVPAKTNGIAV